MLVSIHQPNFLPWVGYFIKINCSDTFVFLDDVDFSKGSRTNRIELLVSGQRHWLTVPIRKSHKQICDIEINENVPWQKKLLNSFKCNYKGASYYAETYDLLEQAIAGEQNSLSAVNIQAVEVISAALGLETHFVKSSSLKITEQGTKRLIDIVKGCDGNAYLSGRGAVAYMQPDLFTQAGLQLSYQPEGFRAYPQFNSSVFQPGLSVIDMIANLGLKGTREYIDEYPLEA